MKSKRIQTIHWLDVLFTAVLLCLPLPFLMSRSLPFIYNDEFGYWGSAAAFAGYDWSEVISRIPYYSYGYSLFLAPLLLLFPNTADAYHAALLLNGLWLALTFWVLRAIVRRLFPDISPRLRAVFAFVSTLFSSSFTQVNFTWPEVLLYLLYCVLFLLVVLAAQSPRLWHYPAMALVCVYSYTVHQRTLGLAIAVGMFVLWQFFTKKITWRHLLAFAAVLAGCWLGAGALKAFVKQTSWPQTTDAVEATNEMSGQLGKIQMIFTPSGMFDFILSLSGKVFYMAAASMLVVFVTGTFCVQRLWQDFCTARREKSLVHVDTVNAFLFLSTCATVVISAIFMIVPGSTAHLYYGRYSDHIMGVLMLIGLCELYRRRVSWKMLAHSLVFFLLLSITAAYYRLRTGVSGDISINIAGIGPFVEYGTTHFVLLFLLSGGLFCLFVLLQRQPIQVSAARRSAIMAGICLMTWICTGLWSYLHFTDTTLPEASRSSQTMADTIQDLSDELDVQMVDVGCIRNDGNYARQYAANGVRFLLPTHKISTFTMEAAGRIPSDLPENCFVMIPGDSKTLSRTATPVKASETYLLYYNSPDGAQELPDWVYQGLIDDRTTIGPVVFSEELTLRTDNTGQWCAGMRLPAYQPADDTLFEQEKALVQYVQITDRALAQAMMDAGVPLEEHLAADIHYDAGELNTNGHASNGPNDPLGLRAGQMQFGPYCALGAGTYRVTVHGGNLDGNAKVRVHSGMGSTVYSIAPEAVSDDAVVYQVTLAEGCTDAELCVAAAGEETILITGLDIQWLAPGSEDILPTDRLPLASLQDADGWVAVSAALAEQIQAMTGGAAADSRTYGPAQTVDLAAMSVDGDGALLGGQAVLGAGGVLRGSPLSLDAGTYRVTVTGAGLSRAGFSVLAGGGEETLPLQYLSSSDTRVQYLLVLDEPVEDAELSAYGTDGRNRVRIDAIALQQALAEGGA